MDNFDDLGNDEKNLENRVVMMDYDSPILGQSLNRSQQISTESQCHPPLPPSHDVLHMSPVAHSVAGRLGSGGELW